MFDTVLGGWPNLFQGTAGVVLAVLGTWIVASYTFSRERVARLRLSEAEAASRLYALMLEARAQTLDSRRDVIGGVLSSDAAGRSHRAMNARRVSELQQRIRMAADTDAPRLPSSVPSTVDIYLASLESLTVGLRAKTLPTSEKDLKRMLRSREALELRLLEQLDRLQRTAFRSPSDRALGWVRGLRARRRKIFEVSSQEDLYRQETRSLRPFGDVEQ